METRKSQFSIKRLLWMTLVASFFFAGANFIGVNRLLEYILENISEARPAQKAQLTMASLAMLAMVSAWFAWFAFRLPVLWNGLQNLRNKRSQRREELVRKYMKK